MEREKCVPVLSRCEMSCTFRHKGNRGITNVILGSNLVGLYNSA